jgi:hypothetical protein
MGAFAGVQLDDLVLTSAHLTLRPWRASDAGAVVEIMRDRSMFEFLALPDPYTRAHADAFVTKYGDEGRATGTGIGSAVIETSTGRLVGSAALHGRGYRVLGRGNGSRQWLRGRGIARADRLGVRPQHRPGGDTVRHRQRRLGEVGTGCGLPVRGCAAWGRRRTGRIESAG